MNVLKSKSPAGDLTRFFAKEGVDPLSEAFEGKIAVHAGVGGGMIKGAEAEAAVESALNTERHRRTSAYIHVPFCETHCLYCGFYNKAYKREESGIFADLLIKELELWKSRKAVKSFPVNALYFGGGTPTALEAEDMERILTAVKNTLPLANDCEITVEGRISNMSKEKIETYLECGVNRFSLGVQSFNTDIRRSMGRRSSGEDIIKTLELIKSYNQAAVVLDLIYGFPNQTMDIWLDDLATARSLDLDGFDCYQLNVYGFTLLGKRIAEGKCAPAADNAMKSAMFAKSVEVLSGAFYRRLSINHWARTTRERNFYNQFARGNADCLAFGPGSGGNINGCVYMTERDYDQWKTAVSQGIKPIMTAMVSDKYHELYKTIAEEIEFGWLDLDSLERRFGVPVSAIWSEILAQWERAGLIKTGRGSITLTIAGQFWYVNLSQLLLEYLKQSLAAGI